MTGSMLAHVLRRAVRSLREHLYLNLMATGVIGAALLLLGVFLTVQHNVDGIVDSWDRDVHISAYFHPDIPEERRLALRDELVARPEVKGVRYVSEAEAQAWLAARIEGMEPVLAELGDDVLPASLEIELEKGVLEAQGGIAAFAEALDSPDLAEIDYGQEWVERFQAFLDLLQLLGAVLGSLILLAAVFLVINTVDLVVYNRRHEIEIQKLVGATSGFIVAPYALEGMVQGFGGSLVAAAGLWAVHSLVVVRLRDALSLGLAGELSFLPATTLVGLGLSGVTIGVLAALLSVWRFLRRAP